MRMNTISSCALILAITGMPTGFAMAQQQSDPRTRDQQRQQQNPQQQQWNQQRDAQQLQRTREFAKFDNLRGSRIYNNSDEAVASVRDLIVDRGTGQVNHVVIRSGSILGLGGSVVALPYSMFNWDANEERLTLNTTSEQIQNMPEFDREAWSGLMDEDAQRDHDAAYRQLQGGREGWGSPQRDGDRRPATPGDRRDDAQRPGQQDRPGQTGQPGQQDRPGQTAQPGQQHQFDPYPQDMRDGEAVTLRGVVRQIHAGGRDGQPAHLILESEERGSVKVLLGPAWYSMGFNNAPMRGERVTVEGVKTTHTHGKQDRTPGQLGQQDRPGQQDRQGQTGQTGQQVEAREAVIARRITGERGVIDLRGEDGQAMWGGTHQGQAGQFVPFRYVLMSDIVGTDTVARTENCGEVKTAIIDVNNGEVVFLAVDSNEGFLGIGNETYLVPWSIARVQEGRIVLDAECTQVTSGTTLPDDLSTLREDAAWRQSFRNFDVEAPGDRTQRETAPVRGTDASQGRRGDR